MNRFHQLMINPTFRISMLAAAAAIDVFSRNVTPAKAALENVPVMEGLLPSPSSDSIPYALLYWARARSAASDTTPMPPGPR